MRKLGFGLLVATLVTMLLAPAAPAYAAQGRYNGAIRGFVYPDYNGNGVRDIYQEGGIAGVLVTVAKKDGTFSWPAITDNFGYFETWSLEPGWYVVTEANSPGWVSTTPDTLYVRLGWRYTSDYPVYLYFGDRPAQ